MDKVFIFSGKVARDLIANNFNIIDISENQKDKKRTVFIFSDTKEIRNYLLQKHNIEVK
ncbi:DUF5659 domain-containing protein [Tissierella sp.]|uniref:DUF5659 domain-containing protein n=1 Tax=Tissierella sp. TaxID=41274 RepID=UPI0030273E8D